MKELPDLTKMLKIDSVLVMLQGGGMTCYFCGKITEQFRQEMILWALYK
jgi:hypothetical protein